MCRKMGGNGVWDLIFDGLDWPGEWAVNNESRTMDMRPTRSEEYQTLMWSLSG